jgi:Fe-S-cluster containining protein
VQVGARHGVAIAQSHLAPLRVHANRGIAAIFRRSSVVSYNCTKCPGYCCSYPLIPLDKRDVQRLADHFGITFEAARHKFTKVDGEEPYAMRRKADRYFGKICRFFDTEKRSCTIYAARPAICRDYPGGSCGYYTFLMSERNSQQDPDHVATTWNV